MIKALLFDLDQTLIDREQTMQRFLNEQICRHRPRIKSAASTLVESIFRHQENGYADKLTAYRNACTELNEDSALAQVLFEGMEQRYGENPILFEGAGEVLASLQDEFRLGLITNGRRKVQSAKINSSGLHGFFDSILISGQVGVKKPDPAIFHLGLDALAVRPDQAVFIGDHPVNDIEAAAAVGMQTIWFENNHYHRPACCDDSIGSLAELRQVINRIQKNA